MDKFTRQELDELTRQAQANPRLRQHRDLRTSPADTSQRMLNALEPGTQVPIHRHPHTSETVAVIRGTVMERIYNHEAKEIDAFRCGPGEDCRCFSVPPGVWHTTESLASGTVILEMKDGPFRPIAPQDIIETQS